MDLLMFSKIKILSDQIIAGLFKETTDFLVKKDLELRERQRLERYQLKN